MDPATVAGVVGKLVWNKALSKAADKLLSGAVSAARDRRAQAFVRSFVEAVAGDSAADPATVSAKLEELSKSETFREALFMAYRRVALSASKDTGPRFIALLTARLIRDQRPPTEVEERLLNAAETLSDTDFQEVVEFLDATETAKGKGQGEVEEHAGWIWRRLHTEVDDSSWPRGEVDLSAVNFADELGIWALKLRNAGLVMDRVVLRRVPYSEDSERGVDQPGTETRWSWWVIVREELLHFGSLIKSAMRSAPL
jgi:hypothetical protein